MVPSLFDKNCCIVEVLVFARDEIEVSLAPSLLVTFLHVGRRFPGAQGNPYPKAGAAPRIFARGGKLVPGASISDGGPPGRYLFLGASSKSFAICQLSCMGPLKTSQ